LAALKTSGRETQQNNSANKQIPDVKQDYFQHKKCCAYFLKIVAREKVTNK